MSDLHKIWWACGACGPTCWAKTSGRSDRKWIFGEFLNMGPKKSFWSIGGSSPGSTGSRINMRISLLETRNMVGCSDGARFSIFISTSGQQGRKVKNVKIAFFENRSFLVACCGQTGSSIHTLSSLSYRGRSAALNAENHMAIGLEMALGQIFKHGQFGHHVSDI